MSQRLRIAVLGDTSDHSGILVTTNQDDRALLAGIPICVDQCVHCCPIIPHGCTKVTAITVKTYINGKLVITWNAVAGCGARIRPPDRKAYAE